MKKLYKILTLCLAAVMLLGIMATSASAAEYERQYLVWTEDELRDLSISRPDANGRYVELYVIPRDKSSDELYNLIFKDEESHIKYVGQSMCIIVDNNNSGKFSSEALKAAREAYDRNTDTTWKKVIAETFGLNVNSSGNTATKPEQPTTTAPVTPVTPPVTTTPTAPVKVDSFSDVKPGDWYYDAVMALANSGIVVGFADGTFRPNQTITAGELATIFCRIYGLDLSKPVPRAINHCGHDDSTVNTGHWAENAINYCVYYTSTPNWYMCIANMEANRGWAIGQLASAITSAKWPDGTTLSGPTSSEKKVILSKIPDVASGASFEYTSTEDPLHYSNYRVAKTPEFSAVATGEEVIAHDYMYAAGKTYSSDCDLTAWKAGRIAEAYHIGLVNGVDSTGRCDPWAPVTRAQVVQMLYNIGITQAGQLTPTNWSELASNSGLSLG